MRQKTRQLALDLGATGEAPRDLVEGTEAQPSTPRPATLAHDQTELRARALTSDLMEAATSWANMRSALKKVRSNKGSPGVDGMTVNDLERHLIGAWPDLEGELLRGEYKPQPLRRVDIPKPDGGTRQLGIPTVIDRLIQQALLQVLDPILDPTFSESSYGFRRGRNAHQALEAAREYVAEGYNWVVDLDLEKFFDRVNHDMLMGRLAKRIGDKRVLRLIRLYLEAGILCDGVVMARDEGTPQGGPLSPLLANILLDDLDKMLEQRGHRFCRYADDCNIYVKSERAGQRVLASVTDFIERKLKLKVNKSKSAVDRPKARKFLGQRVLGGREHTYLGIHPKSVLRAKNGIRRLTQRNRGVSFRRVLTDLRQLTDGWVSYHRYARCTQTLKRLDGWIRRKLRCYIWKQWKTPRNRAVQMCKLGLDRYMAYGTAYNNDGPWKSAGIPAVTRSLTNNWLRRMGFHSLHEQYVTLASV